MRSTQATIDHLQALRLGLDEAIDLAHRLSAGELMGLLDPEVPARLRAAAADVLRTTCTLQMLLNTADEELQALHAALGIAGADAQTWPQIALQILGLNEKSYERLIADGELDATA